MDTSITDWLRQNMAIAGIVVVGLILAVVFLKKPTTSPSTTNSSISDYSGLATDANGNHIVYVPTSDTFINNISGSYNTNPTMPIPTAPGGFHEYPIEPPLPSPKNTSGDSNNFWVYTIQPGDTLNSITAKANWTPDKQQNGGPGFLFNYRNNAAIFGAIGASVASPDTQLPAGYQISL